MKQLQNKGVYAKPPDSRDNILTNEIPHTESRTVAGERIALETIKHIKLPQILRDLNTHTYTVTAPNVDARGIFTNGSTYLVLTLGPSIARFPSTGYKLACFPKMTKYGTRTALLPVHGIQTRFPPKNTEIWNIKALFSVHGIRIVSCLYAARSLSF